MADAPKHVIVPIEIKPEIDIEACVAGLKVMEQMLRNYADECVKLVEALQFIVEKTEEPKEKTDG